MIWPFQLIKKRRDLSAVTVKHFANPKCERLHDEWLLRWGFCRCRQPLTKQAVHGSFERVATMPNLQLNLPGYVVVDGQCGSHIMMFSQTAS